MELSEYEKNSLIKLEETIQKGKWSNKGLVQLIELSGEYLNIMTIADYARANKLSYNGVKKTREIIKLFNKNFVIDND